MRDSNPTDEVGGSFIYYLRSGLNERFKSHRRSRWFVHYYLRSGLNERFKSHDEVGGSYIYYLVSDPNFSPVHHVIEVGYEQSTDFVGGIRCLSKSVVGCV